MEIHYLEFLQRGKFCPKIAAGPTYLLAGDFGQKFRTRRAGYTHGFRQLVYM